MLITNLNKNNVKELNLINKIKIVIEPIREPSIILVNFTFLFNITDEDKRIIKSYIKLTTNITSKYTFISHHQSNYITNKSKKMSKKKD